MNKYLASACITLTTFAVSCIGFAQDSSAFYHPPTSISASNEAVFQVTIDPRHRTSLTAEVASPVTKIYKKMGDDFKKGEILIQLNDVIFKSNLNKAEASLEKAKTELDAKKQLFHDNVASLFELKDGEANVATAEADKALAQRNLDGTTILGPYDGKVVTVYVEEYETPQLGAKLIDVVDDKVLIVKFLVPSSLLPKLKVGLPYQIKINETGEKISAKISRIGAVIDPSSGTVKIESDIDNAQGQLKAGMTGQAVFDDEGKK